MHDYLVGGAVILMPVLAVAVYHFLLMPARLNRLEAILPIVLEATQVVFAMQLVLARRIKNGIGSGELDDATSRIKDMKTRMERFLSGAAVSPKEKR